jgi:hypothetical protein
VALAVGGFAQVLGVAVAFAGDQIFQVLGLARHPRVVQLLEYRMQALGVGFLASSVAQNMATSGAFEVSLNGQTLYSTLDAKRMPTIEEVVLKLDEHGLPVPVHFRAQLGKF